MADDEPHKGEELEDAFFAGEHARLLEQLRGEPDRQELRDKLRHVVRIQDPAFIDRLITMDIRPETAFALRLIPLVAVAWADGHVDEREREAILRAAKQQGLAADSSAHDLLESWLSGAPDSRLLPLWKAYMQRIWNRFTPDEQWQVRENLFTAARDVAEAAGKFLGLTSGISASERAVLDELEKTLS